MRKLVLAAALMVVAGIGGYWALVGAAPVEIPYEDAERVAEGAPLYAAHCAACHGENLEGEPDWQMAGDDGYWPAPPHDETGHTWHHQDELLFRITKLGSAEVVGGGHKSNMMGFGDILSDREILSVLAFIKSTWPDRVIEQHNRVNGRPGG
ncbi:c-type cytochrome [Ovoidimarina sediminis]|uniref:c-type cytochrome n=1 Tax=Ovoidimarina sediminis TaxID=3079856 RepID=UPI0029135F74|nr:c-type cytochrome [Rhodophyticola sp. MJ-SS7]MDU8943925.1 c-type cytochrome [Rhodophyticola sp. MJ-SS7]